jgi:surfeit locus 1 family protein
MQGTARLGARRRWPEHLFFGLPIASTLSLGTWQVQRLDRKNRLIAERAAKLAAPPLSLADLVATPDLRDLEYRRVSLRGTLRHDAEMFVGPRSAPAALPAPVLQWAGSAGFLIVTPLDLAAPPPPGPDPRPLLPLVVRGWVPQRLADRGARAAATITPAQFREAEGGEIDDEDAEQEIVAVVRRGAEERNRFTPNNASGSGEWYYVDGDAMAACVAVTEAAGGGGGGGPAGGRRSVVLELVAPETASGWPFVKPLDEHLQFRTPPSTHVVYAVTWFSLAAALSALTRMRYRASALQAAAERSRQRPPR